MVDRFDGTRGNDCVQPVITNRRLTHSIFDFRFFPSICMPVRMSIHMPTQVSIHMPTHMSIHTPANMPIHMPKRMPVHVPAHMLIHMPTHMSIYMPKHTSIVSSCGMKGPGRHQMFDRMFDRMFHRMFHRMFDQNIFSCCGTESPARDRNGPCCE